MRFNKLFLIPVFAVLFLSACSKPETKMAEQIAEIKKADNATQSLDSEGLVPDRVLFAYGEATVEEKYKASLDAQATFLKENNIKEIAIGGYCDSRGSKEHNFKLGNRRAMFVKNYLQSKGATTEMVVKSYCKNNILLVQGNTEDAHRQNRTAVITLK